MQLASGALMSDAYTKFQTATGFKHSVAMTFRFIVWVGMPWTVIFYIALDKSTNTIWVTNRCYNRLQGLASQNTHAFVAATNVKWQSRFGRIKFQILYHVFSATTMFMLFIVFGCKSIVDKIKGTMWWSL